jgi:hypothetical protein
MNEQKQHKLLSTPKGERVYRRRKVLPTDRAQELSMELPEAIDNLVKEPTKAVKIGCHEDGILTIRYLERRPLAKLPTGYYFKGSAPRELLRETFFSKQRTLTVRDLDLVRFTASTDKDDHRLAMKYMADDYQFGHGVEVVEDSARYFATRDFTINEVLYSDRTLTCTFNAILDLASHKVRATEHVRDAEGVVQSRVTAKALRLQAEAEVVNQPVSLEAFGDNLHITSFDLALHLDRALAISQSVAEAYLLRAWEEGLILPERKVPPAILDAVKELAPRVTQGVRLFKNLPREVTEGLIAG